MLTPAMAQEVWKSPERPSIEKRPGRYANTVSIPGDRLFDWIYSYGLICFRYG